jgi:hypothetical protein
MKSNTKDFLLPVLIFGLMGFLGPIIRWLTWPPTINNSQMSTEFESLIYNLVLFLWPTQPLSIIEKSTGHLIAGLLTISVNVALFAIIGTIAGLASKIRFGLTAFFIILMVMIFLFSLWIAGFNVLNINKLSIVIAIFFYLIPFVLTFHFFVMGQINSISVK